jgi:hypothetical protein
MVGQSRLMERLCCMLCWPLVLPAEIGIILLDNLCAGDKKLKVLDKNKVPNYQQVLHFDLFSINPVLWTFFLFNLGPVLKCISL